MNTDKEPSQSAKDAESIVKNYSGKYEWTLNSPLGLLEQAIITALSEHITRAEKAEQQAADLKAALVAITADRDELQLGGEIERDALRAKVYGLEHTISNMEGNYKATHIPRTEHEETAEALQVAYDEVKILRAERDDWKAAADCYKQSRDEATEREKALHSERDQLVQQLEQAVRLVYELAEELAVVAGHDKVIEFLSSPSIAPIRSKLKGRQ